MPKYRLIGGSLRSFVSLAPLYERADRDLPKNLSIIITGWRKAIQGKLDAEDAHTIALCKQHGVVEEGEPVRRRRSRK